MVTPSGTLGYLSPEGMQSWANVDYKLPSRQEFSCKESDVFALGATLYEMITQETYVSMRERRADEVITAVIRLADMLQCIEQCRSAEVRGGV